MAPTLSIPLTKNMGDTRVLVIIFFSISYIHGHVYSWEIGNYCKYMGFPGGSEVKASAWNAGDPGSIPGSGRSPGEGNGNPLQYSCLENPWREEPGKLQSMGSRRVWHDWVTSLHFTSNYMLVINERKLELLGRQNRKKESRMAVAKI